METANSVDFGTWRWHHKLGTLDAEILNAFNFPKGKFSPPISMGEQVRILSDETRDLIFIQDLDPHFDKKEQEKDKKIESDSVQLCVSTGDVYTAHSIENSKLLELMDESLRNEFRAQVSSAHFLFRVLMLPIARLEEELESNYDKTQKLSEASRMDYKQVAIHEHHGELHDLRVHTAKIRKLLHGFEALIHQLLDPKLGAFIDPVDPRISIHRVLRQDAQSCFSAIANHIARALSKSDTLRNIHESIEAVLFNLDMRRSEHRAEITNVMLFGLGLISLFFLTLSIIGVLSSMNTLFPWNNHEEFWHLLLVSILFSAGVIIFVVIMKKWIKEKLHNLLRGLY